MVKLIGTMLALAALAALGIWLLWGNTALTAHEISVSSPRLPGAFDGLRIAQVSTCTTPSLGRTTPACSPCWRSGPRT